MADTRQMNFSVVSLGVKALWKVKSLKKQQQQKKKTKQNKNKNKLKSIKNKNKTDLGYWVFSYDNLGTSYFVLINHNNFLIENMEYLRI